MNPENKITITCISYKYLALALIVILMVFFQLPQLSSLFSDADKAVMILRLVNTHQTLTLQNSKTAAAPASEKKIKFVI